MPELPEVETIRRGIEPHIEVHTIQEIIVRRLTISINSSVAENQEPPSLVFI